MSQSNVLWLIIDEDVCIATHDTVKFDARTYDNSCPTRTAIDPDDTSTAASVSMSVPREFSFAEANLPAICLPA